MSRLIVQLTEADDRISSRVTFETARDVGGQTHIPDGRITVSAVLKALNSSSYKASDFLDAENEYLRAQDYLVDSPAGTHFAPSMRQTLGGKLFAWLFPNRETFSVFAEARRTQRRVDIELRFDADSALVNALPWELIHDGKDFIVAGGRGTLQRLLTFDGFMPPCPPVTVDPLRVLLISPRPGDVPRLGDAEVAALQRIENVELMPLDGQTTAHLSDYLDRLSNADAPHVIHFDGHGTYGRRCNNCLRISGRRAAACFTCKSPDLDDDPEGFLAWEDERGNVDWVSARKLADQLGLATGEADLPLRLVLLSACSSAVAIGGESAFSGIAQRLIRAAVPSVVAMQFRIDTAAATKFTGRFYRNLSIGTPLSQAVARARTELDLERDQWYRPVLYLRAADNEEGDFFHAPRRQLVVVSPTPPAQPTARLGIVGADVDEPFTTIRTALAELGTASGSRALTEALRPFVADFYAIHEQLDLLRDYKDLHDQLHELKLNVFAPIEDDLEALREDDRSLIVTTSRYDLKFWRIISRLREIGDRAHVPAAHYSWITDLKAAHNELKMGVQNANASQIRWALELMRPVIDTQPMSINTRLADVAAGLKLSRLSNAFEAVVAGQDANGLPVASRELLNQGIAALGAVQRMLTTLVQDHTDWQRIEIALLGAEQLLASNTLDRFGWRWRSLSLQLQGAIGPALEQNQPILDACSRITQALTIGDLDGTITAFDECCRGVEMRIYDLDDQLKRLCGRLGEVATGVGRLTGAAPVSIGVPA